MSHTSGRAPNSRSVDGRLNLPRARQVPPGTNSDHIWHRIDSDTTSAYISCAKKRGYSIILSTATSRCGAGNPVAGGRVQADWLAMSRETINAFGGRNRSSPILTREAEKD